MNVHYASRKNGNGVWCYAEKGESSDGHSHRRHHGDKHHQHQHKKKNYPTFVFLHGFGADKDTWPSILIHIPAYFHCIVVDLPGHGDTTFIDGVDEPSVESYVKSLREFLEVTNLDSTKIYLIGCSFGGAVAALFAHTYPELVQNLALLCPAIKTPILTETCQQLIQGKYELLIPKNGEEFTTMIKLLTHKSMFFPYKIMQSYVNINFHLERQVLLKKLLDSLVTTELQNFETNLQFKLSAIKVPTLIIWGKNDEVSQLVI